MPLTLGGVNRRKPTSFLQGTTDTNSLGGQDIVNPLSQGPTSTGDGEPQGATGATNDLNLDTPSCSSE